MKSGTTLATYRKYDAQIIATSYLPGMREAIDNCMHQCDGFVEFYNKNAPSLKQTLEAVKEKLELNAANLKNNQLELMSLRKEQDSLEIGSDALNANLRRQRELLDLNAQCEEDEEQLLKQKKQFECALTNLNNVDELINDAFIKQLKNPNEFSVKEINLLTKSVNYVQMAYSAAWLDTAVTEQMAKDKEEIDAEIAEIQAQNKDNAEKRIFWGKVGRAVKVASFWLAAALTITLLVLACLNPAVTGAVVIVGGITWFASLVYAVGMGQHLWHPYYGAPTTDEHYNSGAAKDADDAKLAKPMSIAAIFDKIGGLFQLPRIDSSETETQNNLEPEKKVVNS